MTLGPTFERRFLRRFLFLADCSASSLASSSSRSSRLLLS